MRNSESRHIDFYFVWVTARKSRTLFTEVILRFVLKVRRMLSYPYESTSRFARIHFDRVIGGHRDHRYPGGDAFAGAVACQGKSFSSEVPEQSQANGTCSHSVHA